MVLVNHGIILYDPWLVNVYDIQYQCENENHLLHVDWKNFSLNSRNSAEFQRCDFLELRNL